MEVNNAEYKWLSLATGVPQRSILGPFLFLIYMNDMENASNFELIFYADDSTLLSSFYSQEKLKKQI